MLPERDYVVRVQRYDAASSEVLPGKGVFAQMRAPPAKCHTTPRADSATPRGHFATYSGFGTFGSERGRWSLVWILKHP